MKTFSRLKKFYYKANKDPQLKPSHLSLYFGIIWMWQENDYSPKFKVYRKTLMMLAHISSIVTYHKCIRELVDLGYIQYEPSYNHYKGCLMRLNDDL